METVMRKLQAFAYSVLAAATMATAIYLQESVQATGPYSCCGNSDCSTLVRDAACPQGDVHCPPPEYTAATKCCVNSCNDTEG
jgi:hypothetical protein